MPLNRGAFTVRLANTEVFSRPLVKNLSSRRIVHCDIPLLRHEYLGTGWEASSFGVFHQKPEPILVAIKKVSMTVEYVVYMFNIYV